MDMPWLLSETTFTPADAATITGVSPGLQRAWRMRRWLVAGSRARAVVTLSGVIELIVLKHCSDAKIGLETVKHALPAICAEAVIHLALMKERWAYIGGDDTLGEFRKWAEPLEMRGAQYIYRMLDIAPDSTSRYLLIRRTEVRLLNDLNDLMDEYPEEPGILLDSWGIARGLAKRTKREFFWIRKAQES